MATSEYRTDAISPEGVVLPPPRRMTEQDFIAWCDEDTRAEWVDGEVVMMSPASNEHDDLIGWLVAVLRPLVEQEGLGLVRGPEFTVRLGNPPRRRVPDVLFVAQERLGLIRARHFEGAPDMCVEVVSPDSAARDWREKYLEYVTVHGGTVPIFAAQRAFSPNDPAFPPRKWDCPLRVAAPTRERLLEYEAAGVREYWVIDLGSEHAEAYSLGPKPGEDGLRYRRIAEVDGRIDSTVIERFRLKTVWLWPNTRPKVLDALRELGVI